MDLSLRHQPQYTSLPMPSPYQHGFGVKVECTRGWKSLYWGWSRTFKAYWSSHTHVSDMSRHSSSKFAQATLHVHWSSTATLFNSHHCIGCKLLWFYTYSQCSFTTLKWLSQWLGRCANGFGGQDILGYITALGGIIL